MACGHDLQASEGKSPGCDNVSVTVGSEPHLDGEAAVAPAAPFVHVGTSHLSHRAALLDERQHVRLALHNELTQPDDTQQRRSMLKMGCISSLKSFLTLDRAVAALPGIDKNFGPHSPVDVDAQIGVFPDFETDVLFGVEEVMHHLVVDLEIAHGNQALCAVRRQPLKRTVHPPQRRQMCTGRAQGCSRFRRAARSESMHVS